MATDIKKAPGIDRINNNLIKHVKPALIVSFTILFQSVHVFWYPPCLLKNCESNYPT